MRVDILSVGRRVAPSTRESIYQSLLRESCLMSWCRQNDSHWRGVFPILSSVHDAGHRPGPPDLDQAQRPGANCGHPNVAAKCPAWRRRKRRVPPISRMLPQKVYPRATERGKLSRTLLQAKPGGIEKTTKPAKTWVFTGLSVVRRPHPQTARKPA